MLRQLKKPWIVMLLVCWVLALTGGCIFFEVPREAAVRAAVDPIDGLAGKGASKFHDLSVLSKAVDGGLAVVAADGEPVDAQKYVRVSRFLHISDAQIRDESIYESPWYIHELLDIDKMAMHSIRRPYVEAFDGLTFASFLIAYSKANQRHDHEKMSGPNPFVIHTGDLLDISVITEVTEAMQVMRSVVLQHRVPVLSMGGNHDGLTFGNLEDQRTYTRGLGVNKSEFVLAHLLAYPDVKGTPDFARGFGYANNEIVARYYFDQTPIPSFSCPNGSGKDWFPRVARQLEDIQDARKARDILLSRGSEDVDGQRQSLSYPIFIKQNVETSGEADFDGIKLGYYSWTEPVDSASVKGVRYIALDTRSSISRDGHIDLVQIGWLYNELRAALAAREVVVIFAHHAPDLVKHPGLGALPWYAMDIVYRPESSDFTMPTDRNTELFADLLRGFPNIVGYFHGHLHENQAIETHDYGSFPLIQTGSMADFPQVGRLVDVYCHREGREALVTWRFVRPKGDRSTPDGRVLQAYLDASQYDARKEHNEISPKEKRVGSWSQWKVRHLSPGSAAVQISFDASRVPSPEKLIGPKRMALINRLRTELGLKPIKGSSSAGGIHNTGADGN